MTAEKQKNKDGKTIKKRKEKYRRESGQGRKTERGDRRAEKVVIEREREREG